MALGVEVVLVAAGVLGVLGFFLIRSRRETSRLRRRLEEASMELQRLQQSFARFAPEDVVEGIIARGIETSGERKEVTALFADLVGFTALSESVEPAVLVRILNGYFERVSRAVTERRGHVGIPGHPDGHLFSANWMVCHNTGCGNTPHWVGC